MQECYFKLVRRIWSEAPPITDKGELSLSSTVLRIDPRLTFIVVAGRRKDLVRPVTFNFVGKAGCVPTANVFNWGDKDQQISSFEGKPTGHRKIPCFKGCFSDRVSECWHNPILPGRRGFRWKTRPLHWTAGLRALNSSRASG